MDEKSWVKSTLILVGEKVRSIDQSLNIYAGKKLAYANEIKEYLNGEPVSDSVVYETDFLITEERNSTAWKPRIVIEAKLGRVTTHDAITYSEKAFYHKKVHPYLRYGIIIGNRGNQPLPRRLFRHGAYFDFMISWVGTEPQTSELKDFLDLISMEINASRNLEEILYTSRKKTSYIYRFT
jgi:hypothetical protein